MGSLKSQPAPGDSPLTAWLTLQCQMIVGAEAAMAVLGSSEDAPSAEVAHWPSDEKVTPRLKATVEAAQQTGKLAVQEPSGDPGSAQTTALALPLKQRGAPVGAFGVDVRGIPRERLKALVDLMRWCARGLEILIDTHGNRGRLAARLSLAGSLLDHPSLAEASHELCAELVHNLGCERVAVGLERAGRLRVIALSSSLCFVEETEAVRDAGAAMEEAVDQDTVIEFPSCEEASSDAHATRAHELLLRGSGARVVRSIPLAARGRSVGALMCEWAETSELDAAARSRMDDAAVLCGPILELMARGEASLRERARDGFAGLRTRYLGEDRTVARWTAIGAAALVVFLAVFPAPHRVSARATLEGRVQRALVAAVDGYIAEANRRAGDLVQAGDVLARLDDRDLRLEHRRWESERAKLEKEYREALAAEDRTQVSIVRAQIEQTSAQLGLAREELGRTTVIAPFDGIILEGDLDRSLGSPVDRGTVLFELAPLDGYRIIVQVDERDIANVAVGQRGRLALSALPGRPLTLAVERITPIATAEEGRNYFRVEAVLEEPVDALRPGMEGIAKIHAGRRPLLWIWTHEMFDWLRLRAWSFLP